MRSKRCAVQNQGITLNRDQVMTLETWLKIDSVIYLKTGKHSDFRISSFQVVDA